jgi:simple sugar transport system permease protein
MPALAVLASLAVGSVFILLARANPLETYRNLMQAGFGCAGPGARCALLTALQFSVPLLLGGLSATVALRAGFFSLGQSGQMLLGAAAACWLGSNLDLPPGIHAAVALAGGAACGAAWAWGPAVLKDRTGINEVVVTLIANPIAGVLVGLVRLRDIAPTARMQPLVEGTKLSAGLIVALAAALLVYAHLWHTGQGYEQRMAAQAPRFARYGGIPGGRPMVRAVLIGGALAGLAGAVEVLGVQYRFITSFSAVDNFDGLVVAFAGQLHPLGVVLFAVLLGGMRAGAVVGLQIQSGIPRELGGAIIAMMLIFVAAEQLFRRAADRLAGGLAFLSAARREPRSGPDSG